MNPPTLLIKQLYELAVEGIFLGFLQQDPDVLKEINVFKGNVNIINDRLVFTLPALFDFASNQFEQSHLHKLPRTRSNYLAFRKQLYNNPTNTLLQQQGGMVEMEQSNDDHDMSRYRLRRLSSL